ncbi:MAG: hypothetical protein HOV81_21665 [Kofleriaceae bacterium]|nr:hypothetical protein [Kofleriaceae bacterium]
MTRVTRSLCHLAIALAIVLSLFGTAFAAPRLESLPSRGRIEVRYERGLEDTARTLQASAEDTLTRISGDLLELPTPRHIRVQLVRDSSSLPSVAPEGRGAPPWAIGVAYPDLGIISVAIRRGSSVTDPEQTLRHELAHVALGAAIGDRAPHWLHEGFAYQHSAEWAWERTETLAGMAWFGGIVPLEQLDASFPAEESPAHRAYAQSYDFVGFLSRRGRWEDTADDGDRWPFRRFLTMVGQGVSLNDAAKKAYGKPLGELFEEWREDLSKRYLLAPIGLFGLAVWCLCALLLGLAWWRKRRHNKRRLAEWERDERANDEALARLRPVIVPPYIPWPGEDPFKDDDEEPSGEPKLVN